jgi:hypothetical protein
MMINLYMQMIGRRIFRAIKRKSQLTTSQLQIGRVALPKLFKASKNEGYQVVRSDDEVLQFKNEQVRFAHNFISHDWN